MRSDNFIQISGFLIKDAVTKEEHSYASFTLGRKLGNQILYLNCIAFSSPKFKIPFDILKKGKEIFVLGSLRPNTYTKDGKTYNTIQIAAEKIRETDDN